MDTMKAKEKNRGPKQGKEKKYKLTYITENYGNYSNGRVNVKYRLVCAKKRLLLCNNLLKLNILQFFHMVNENFEIDRIKFQAF